MFRSYLFKIVLFLLPGVGVLLLNYVFLLKTGELLSLRQLAKQQQERADLCIYGTAVHDDTFYYKIEEYAERKPDVVVLGSSRVMQFRQSFFRNPFFNFGGSMSNINQGQHLLPLMMARHQPKLVLIGMDFWWFNDRFAPVKYQDHPLPPKQRLRLEYLFDPISFLFQGKISVGRFVDVLLQSPDQSAQGLCTIGIGANVTGTGYGPDGSYYYGVMLTGGKPEDADTACTSTLRRVEQGNNRFEYADHVNAEHFAHFTEFVGTIQAQNIPVILFFPPLAPTVHEAVKRKQDRYGYFAELRTLLSQAGLKFYDFEDPSTVQTNNCEFVDGFHGGDTTTARVLLALSRKDPKVRQFVDMNALQEMILENRGRAFIADLRAMREKEADFLKIGCQK